MKKCKECFICEKNKAKIKLKFKKIDRTIKCNYPTNKTIFVCEHCFDKLISKLMFLVIHNDENTKSTEN